MSPRRATKHYLEKGWVLWFQCVKDRFVLPMFRSEYSDRNVGKTNLPFTHWNQRTQPFSWLRQWRSPRLISFVFVHLLPRTKGKQFADAHCCIHWKSDRSYQKSSWVTAADGKLLIFTISAQEKALEVWTLSAPYSSHVLPFKLCHLRVWHKI